MDILTNILSLLKFRGLQQKDLSDHLGLSKNTITGWKNGNNTSYMKYLPQIAEFLDVSVDSLIGNKNKENQSNNDFTFAMYDEIAHDLSPEQMEQVKKFADFLRNS